MKKALINIIVLWVLFIGIAHAQNTTAALTKMSFENTDVSSRLTLILNKKPTRYSVFTLENPQRLIIDLENTQLKININSIQLPSFIVNSIRIGHPHEAVTRLVLDLKSPIQVRNSTFPVRRTKAQIVAIDIYKLNVKKNNVTKLQVAPVVPMPVKKTVVIVIDPGHGGKDPGARGMNGAREKNVVLKISRDLADLINKQPYMRAILTRNGDYFVPLRGRLDSARKGKADLFVAIHADSYFDPRARGASIYALSARGATSEAARWIAQRENYSELGDVDLKDLDDQSHLLRSVLIDLAQTTTVRDSLRLGTSLLDSLDDVTRLHYARVEQAPFVVLKSPDIPSVLVELGFISNPTEESLLCNSVYQKKLARALLSGIQKYIKTYHPESA